MSVLPGRRRRRAVVLIGAVASASLLVAACGGSDEEPAGASGDAGESGAAGDAFPVEIEGALGTTVIEEEPERVVTLGWGQDVVYSLGVLPVGIERDDYAGDADGYAPWYREALEADGAELPQTIQMYPELDTDAIGELEPDLVLAPHSGLEQDVYDQLSQFTDVVAYPDEPWHTEWREQIEISAKALGRQDRGAELIAEVETVLADAAADHPEFAEADFAYVYAGNQLNTLHVYPDFDARVAFLNELGMSMDPAAPQIARRLTGASGPGVAVAAVTGATLTVVADLAVQTVVPDTNLPVGIMTAAFGGVYLAYLLAREWKAGVV